MPVIFQNQTVSVRCLFVLTCHLAEGEETCVVGSMMIGNPAGEWARDGKERSDWIGASKRVSRSAYVRQLA